MSWPSTTQIFWPNLRVKNSQALIDTGSTGSFISYSMIEGEHKESIVIKPCEKTFSTISEPIVIRNTVMLSVCINGMTVEHEFNLYSGKCIIGRDLLAKLPFVIDLETGQLVRKPISFQKPFECEEECMVNERMSRNEFLKQFELSASQNTLSDILWSKREAFSNFKGEVGRVRDFEHHIDTGSASPSFVRQYRVAHSLNSEVKENIEKMLSAGVITPTSSPWSSPYLLVDKPDGSKRFCIDFRKLNTVTTKDKHPMPLIDDLLNKLSNSSIFSSLDLTSGYWHVPLEEHSKKKTAFQACGNQYQFEVMPFGLCNAGATFQRMMNSIFKDFPIVPYVDDTIIHSQNEREHLKTLECVLQKCIDVGLKLNPKKCKFMVDSIKYLGFTVSNGRIFPNENILDKIRAFPIPESPKELERFHGLCQFYQRFVKDFAKYASPLTDVMNLSLPKFRRSWKSFHLHAFNQLRERILSSDWLALPDFSKPFSIDIDASTVAMGAVLYQPEVSERPICFAGKKFSSAEKNYSTTDREFCSLRWAVEKFHHYLYGRHFTVRTDHKPLLGMISGKSHNSRQARWQLFLQDYDFDIKFLSGKDNIVADSLSRCFKSECDTSENSVFAISFVSEDWKEKQSNDPTLQETTQRVLSRRAPRGFQIDSKGVLRYYGRVVLPESEVQQCVTKHHNSGHFGKSAVRNSILSSGFWCPKLGKVIESVASACNICNSKSYNEFGGPWCTLPKAPEVSPFQFLAVDIVGPLPLQADGSKYIVTMIDHATRFLQAARVTNIRADTIADVVFNHWITIFGPPQVLHSDRGTQFESVIFRTLCDKFSIKKSATSVYHPQGNSIVERVHRTLKDRLRTMTGSWAMNLSMAVYEINRMSGSNPSPMQNAFGRDGIPLSDWPKVMDNFENVESNYGPQIGDLVSVRVRNPTPLGPKFSGSYKVSSRPSRFVVQLENGSIVSLRDVKLLI